MMKRFSHMVAYLLLVLMPLQALAAANLMICNSMMQTTAQSETVMPCHDGSSMIEESNSDEVQHQQCKALCAALCASMSVLTQNLQPDFPENYSTAIDAYYQNYVSITQQHLQRPPIFFI